MISPYRIKYAGIASNELNIPDLITCVAMDSDNGESPSFLNRESVASESHDGRYKRIHRLKYTETFAPKITFMKSDFKDFSVDEVRAVMKWLTMKDTTDLLEVFYDDSEIVSFASIGGFIDLQTYKISNNRTIAITAVWDSISPFALSELYTVTKIISSATDNKVTINIDTDDNKPVYPRVTINHGYNSTPHTIVRIPDGMVYTATTDMIPNTVYYNGTTYYWKTSGRTSTTTPPNYEWDSVEVNRELTNADKLETNTIYYYINPTTNVKTYYWIDPYYFHEQSGGSTPTLSTTSARFTNIHTDFFNQSKVLPSVIVKNNNSTETVILDGANKIVSSSNVRRIFGDDFNQQWLELYDGKNEITIEGNCEVTLSWREARKVGEY